MRYEIRFTGTKGKCSVFLESPLPVDCDHEENVHSIIDMGIELGYLEFGADFRERLDTYAISMLFAEEV